MSSHPTTIRLLRPGFTLIEAVLSMALLSIVMVSVGSAMLFASTATPDEDSPVAVAIADHALLARIADDLSQAMYITEQSSTAITVVVPDRTGDGIPDRIRYAWGGTAGEPLKYTVNDTVAANLSTSLNSFSIGYTLENTTQTLPGVVSRLPEQQVDGFDTTLLASQYQLQQDVWCGQVLSLDLDAEVTGVMPTRLWLYLGTSASTDGRIYITVRDWDGTRPGSKIYGQAALDESAMQNGGGWINATLSATQMIPADQDVVLTIVHSDGSGVIAKAYSNVKLGGGMLTTNNGGSSWSVSTLNSLCFSLYGEQYTQGNDFVVTSKRTTEVRLDLASRAGTAAATRATRLLAQPEKLERYWYADFEADPTLMDLNGDGAADWTSLVTDFDVSELDDGVWTVGNTCGAVPPGHFSGVVTVEARLRSTTTDGPALYGPFSAAGSSVLPLITRLRQDGSGGQELIVYNSINYSNPIAILSGLDQGWVDLRLVVLTAEDVVMIEVNGEIAGSLQLTRITQSSVWQTLSIRTFGGGAEIDYLRLGVGGSYTVSNESSGLLGGLLNLLGL